MDASQCGDDGAVDKGVAQEGGQEGNLVPVVSGFGEQDASFLKVVEARGGSLLQGAVEDGLPELVWGGEAGASDQVRPEHDTQASTCRSADELRGNVCELGRCLHPPAG